MHQSTSTVPSLAPASAVSAATSSRARRRRPRTSLRSATALAALALSSSNGPHSSAHAHTGLRGHPILLEQQHHQIIEVDLSGELANRMPQHGQQRPQRPRNLPPHMLPPPGHAEHRRLLDETFAYMHRNTNAMDRGENLTRSGEGEEGDFSASRGLQNVDRPQRPIRRNAPPQHPDAQQALLIEERNKRQKIKGENLKRIKANKKLFKKLQQDREDRKKTKNNNGKSRRDGLQKKNSDRPGRVNGVKKKQNNNKKNDKDKDKDDKKDNDKKDKDKDKKNDKDDKKDKDKDDKKDKGKKDKDKDKKDKDKKPRPKNEVLEPQSDKPDKIKPQNAKPDKDDMKPQNAKPDKIKPQNSKPDKIKPQNSNANSAMTDGKFNLDDYVPPKNDKPKPNNNSGGGGSFSSLVLKPKPKPVAVQQYEPTVPPPTPRPTKRPKTRRPTPYPTSSVGVGAGELSAGVSSALNNDDGSKPFVAASSNPPPTPRPTKTPRPTEGPKPQSVPIQETLNSVATSDGCNTKWCFVSTLTDHSTLLDSFEATSNLDLRKSPINPWGFSSSHAYDGSTSISSGLGSHTYYELGGQPSNSNLTLVTDNNFEGGVLTFRIKSNSLKLPNEAFFVMVDGTIALPPDVAARRLNTAEEWVELSVPVGAGSREVTWVHVYNPFGFVSLPEPEVELEHVGLWMDELRYVPFDSHTYLATDQLEMTTGGGDSEEWKVSSGGNAVVASTSSIGGDGGNADIQFALYSPSGGTLEYSVKTSTTGPNDDFAILFNSDETPAEAIFGDMLGYERRTLAVPQGKVVVTLRHRLNPGGYGGAVLRSLGGEVGTDGKTWLEDLSFRAN